MLQADVLVLKKVATVNGFKKLQLQLKKRGTEGKCTPITKPGCTGRAKALAKTFKKMAREEKISRNEYKRKS